MNKHWGRVAAIGALASGFVWALPALAGNILSPWQPVPAGFDSTVDDGKFANLPATGPAGLTVFDLAEQTVAMITADNGGLMRSVCVGQSGGGDQTVSIAILDLAILQGNMRPRALALVMEWAALHQTAILVDWERAANGEPVLPIPPLA